MLFPKGYRIENTKALEECKLKPCLLCGAMADPHHVKTKKSGGDDVESNLVPLCRKHHSETHNLGVTTFANKHSKFKDWLIANGWELNTFNNKWQRDAEEK